MNAWPPVLAINLSLKQLQTADEFVGSLIQTLTKWGLAPKDLELDVTESMLAHVTLHKNRVLDRLQQLGVNIAIDDFGTQYSARRGIRRGPDWPRAALALGIINYQVSSTIYVHRMNMFVKGGIGV
jgi:EAL domain-containing protein (putative c-di-GMP-specific phosphodiesterase class I)